MDKMREEFEKWFEEDSFPLECNWFKKDEDGEYALTSADFAWQSWKASRAALRVELPVSCDAGGLHCDCEAYEAASVRALLDKAGVRYE